MCDFIPPSTVSLVSEVSHVIELYTYAHAHQEAHHVRLLLLLKFLDICGGLASRELVGESGAYI